MTTARTHSDVLSNSFMRRVARPILFRLRGTWRGLSSQPPGHDHPTTASSTEQRIGEGFFRPVDYSHRVRYRRPPNVYLRLQWLGPLLVGRKIVPKYVVILEVPGRRSGVIHRTTLVRVEHDGEYFLVALAGESEWVRNVRAAAGRVVVGRKERRAATLVEVPSQERAPVIRAYLLRAGRQAGSKAVANEARYYFGVSADPSLEEIQPVVEHYPVFRIVQDGGLPA
jgi:deazaflavin-dependent oxidoreductase (nitroreductase family)